MPSLGQRQRNDPHEVENDGAAAQEAPKTQPATQVSRAPRRLAAGQEDHTNLERTVRPNGACAQEPRWCGQRCSTMSVIYFRKEVPSSFEVRSAFLIGSFGSFSASVNSGQWQSRWMRSCGHIRAESKQLQTSRSRSLQTLCVP